MNILLRTRQTPLWAAAVAALAVAALGIASAAPRPHPAAEPAGPFQYVGLDRTLARVEPGSGRVWVLLHAESSKASLLTLPDDPGWQWREVRIGSVAGRRGPHPPVDAADEP